MSFRTILSTLFALWTLAACASTDATATADASRRDCFRNVDVNGYTALDNQRVKVRISPQREYILTLNRSTRDLDWSHAISIRSPASYVCTTDHPTGVEVVAGDPPWTYTVTNIERVQPTEPAPTGS